MLQSIYYNNFLFIFPKGKYFFFLKKASFFPRILFLKLSLKSHALHFILSTCAVTWDTFKGISVVCIFLGELLRL